ncbi:MAG TPA: DUF1508 domain-containing protein, partial [Gemmataceae bacterium]|nr:DUF1508 domain-containing protein [Gemmataceae bacterium]
HMKAVRHLVLTLALAGAIGAAGTHFAAAQDKKAKDKDVKGVATFEVYKDNGNKYRFRFKDADGVTLAIAPHGYETKADCEKVVEAIRTTAGRAKVADAPTKK